MADLVSSIEASLTALNVHVLGLKPVHINLVKTPLLIAGAGALLWATCVSSSGRRIDRFVQTCERWAAGRPIWLISGSLTLGVTYLALKQYHLFTGEAYDLGIYANSLWHTVHGQWFFDSLKNEHLLGDHFGPILIVFAPFYFLWESPVWLMLAQAAALGLGGVALGLLTFRLIGRVAPVLVMLLVYVSNPYLHSVAALDFHPIALAIPLFLWLLYCLETDRYAPAMVLAASTLLVEESLPPGLAGIGGYLALFCPSYRRTGLALMGLGAVWFLIEVTVLLPHFSRHALIHWDRYDNLGPDFSSALLNLLTHPYLLMTEALIAQHKYYYVAALLLSVGWLPLLAWRQALLIVVPAWMMLLSHNGGHYKFGFHYSAAVLPFLFYSSAHGLAAFDRLRPDRWPAALRSPRALFAVVLAVLLVNTYQIRWSRLSHADPLHAQAVQAVLDVIAPDASVRADGKMVAMLSGRHAIAPITEDIDRNFEWWTPDYFVLDLKQKENNAAQWAQKQALLQSLTNGDRYVLIERRDGVVLLKRRPTARS